MSAWILVSERVPGYDDDVLVYCADTGEQFVGFHIGAARFQYAQRDGVPIACTPTHWMPLPQPPEAA